MGHLVTCNWILSRWGSYSQGLTQFWCCVATRSTGMLVQCIPLPSPPPPLLSGKGPLRVTFLIQKQNRMSWSGCEIFKQDSTVIIKTSPLLSYDRSSCTLEHCWRPLPLFFHSWPSTLRHTGHCPDGCIRTRLCWCCWTVAEFRSQSSH